MLIIQTMEGAHYESFGIGDNGVRINPAADELHLGHENPLGNRIDARYS